MITAYYKSKSAFLADEYHWVYWDYLGFFNNILDATNAIKKKKYTLTLEDSLTYQGTGIYNQCFYFRFYDTDTKEFLSIEPWKVGLNDCASNNSSR